LQANEKLKVRFIHKRIYTYIYIYIWRSRKWRGAGRFTLVLRLFAVSSHLKQYIYIP